MTAKQYLMRAWHIDRRIDRLIEERDRLESTLTRGVGQLTGLPRGGGHDWTDTAIRVADLTARIGEEIRALCEIKREVSEAIDQVEDKRAREVLTLRYRNYMAWPRIAEELGYDVRHVFRLHGEGLARVKHVIECHY